MLGAVCKISGPRGGGTGFICKLPLESEYRVVVGLITCHHVINTTDLSELQQFHMHFEGALGSIRLDAEVLGPYRQTYSNVNDIDTTFLELSEASVMKLLHFQIHILEHEVCENEDILIVGYPENPELEQLELCISFGRIQMCGPFFEGRRIYLNYRASTLPGSSGSPVINIKGFVVGMHQAGTEQKGHSVNRAVNIEIIIMRMRGIQMNLKEHTESGLISSEQSII